MALAALGACALLFMPLLAGAQTIEYTVLTLGKPSGAEVVNHVKDKSTSTYTFNDRGRGPELKSSWRVDSNGMPLQLQISGKSYMKTPLSETFARSDAGVGSWTAGGKKTTAAAPGGFYLPLDAPPSYQALLATALLRAPGNSLPLLPVGTATAREVAREQVKLSSGESMTVRAIQISGMSYEPTVVWLDDSNRLFADVSSWFSVVRKTATSEVDRLLGVEEAIARTYREDLAKSLSDIPAGPLLIRNSRLFDPRTRQATAGTSVLVIGKRIAAVGPDGKVHVPEGVRTIDAGQRFLMPGLWDNHVHITGVDTILNLASGITSVRDLANDEQVLPELEKRIDAGTELGPRIVRAGFIDAEGPFSGPTRARIKTQADAERWIDWYAQNGYRQIKVYSSMDPAMIAPLANFAHARALRLSGHVPAFMTAQQFVEAGADEIQHLNFIFLNFLAKEAADTRGPTRFTAVGRHAMDIDPADPRVKQFIDFLVARQTVLDPTINIFEDMFEGAPDRISPGYENIVGRLPPVVARNMVGGEVTSTPEDKPRYAQAMPALKRMLKALHEAGVAMVPGSDSPSGFGLLRELEVWSAAGISNADVLRAATLTSAQVNRRASDVGVVAPGMLADFILVDGDPLQNISDLHKVRTIVKDGVLYDAAKLYAAVGVQPAP